MSNFENAKVKVSQGWLQGYTEGNLKIFKGIPYAAPPVGALRFRKPQEPGRCRGGYRCPPGCCLCVFRVRRWTACTAQCVGHGKTCRNCSIRQVFIIQSSMASW